MERVDWWNRDTEPTKCGLVFHLVIAVTLMTAISVYTAVTMSSDRELSVGDIVAISVTVSVSLLWIVLTVAWYNKWVGNVTGVVISCIKVHVKQQPSDDDIEAQGLQTISSESPKVESKDKASEPMIPTVVVDGVAMPQTKI